MDAGNDLGKSESTALADREIVATRLLDVPRDLVFAAWTDTAHLEKWWGPVGFTTTTRRATFEAGGQWRFVMHGPDGIDYENLITFVEVQRPSRIAYRHGGEGATKEVTFEVTRTFEAPRELVWRAHTEAEHLARWWGPKGFETTVARPELRPGGMFL